MHAERHVQGGSSGREGWAVAHSHWSPQSWAVEVPAARLQDTDSVGEPKSDISYNRLFM